MAGRREIAFVCVLVLLMIRGAAAMPVDIVFCMDLSGSTNGLLDNLKTKFWDVSNEISMYSPPAQLRVGVVAYSRPKYGKENYYIKIISDLTGDLDRVENELLSIKTITEQGKQYVGPALLKCVEELSWSKDKNALKVIFIVGNGLVNLGGNEYMTACEKAVAKKIIVNSVFCKTYVNMEEIMQWKKIADLGRGTYYEIDINRKPVLIPSDFDNAGLENLNTALNNTYLYYGPEGKSRGALQVELDNKMKEMHFLYFLSRATAKASANYQGKNKAWDLVDLSNETRINFSNIDRNLLPDSLHAASDDDLKKAVDMKWSERRKIIESMKIIGLKRIQAVKEKKAEIGVSESNTFTGMVIECMEKLAKGPGVKTGN